MDEKSLLGLVFIIAALVLVVWWSDTFVELLFLYIPFFNSIPFQLLAFLFLFLVVRPFTSRKKKKEKEESPERICIRISNLTVSAQAL
jgi:predicted transporter